ncbi:MAG: N-acetyltransferase [Proteobacteria bacterium]|nr:N-acetyltransferase [Pseudomonadota bacterium]
MIAPAKSLPEKIIHQGKYCRLEPINSKTHGKDLWLYAGSDEEVWTYLSNGPFANEQLFFDWLKFCENHPTRTYYSVIDKNENALGALCLMDYQLEHASVELGGIFFSKKLQRTTIATEAVYLLSRYAFEDLAFRRLQWICNVNNKPSEKAALRFGFKEEGILRNHWIVRGQSRDSKFFSIIESEWKERRDAFEKWLAEENFDAEGKQKKRLEEFK